MEHEDLKRFERTLAILILLQSKRIVKASWLSERFGVSLRTIYRDIRSLEAAGVPVIGEAGVGYSIMEGYRLPPVMFTREEAMSFVAAEKLMKKFTDASLGANFEKAITKIKAVLKGQDKDWIDALETQVWAAPASEVFNNEVPNALEILFNSIASSTQVHLEYQTFGASGQSSRHIEPIGIFHENDHWYIWGYCHLRTDYRQFRTDRIRAIQATTLPFTRSHEDIDRQQSDCPDRMRIRVVIAVDKSAMRYLGDGKKYFGLVSQKEHDNEVELEFLTMAPAEGLARWFLMFGDCARIIEPESFRQQVLNLATTTIANLEAATLEVQ